MDRLTLCGVEDDGLDGGGACFGRGLGLVGTSLQLAQDAAYRLPWVFLGQRPQCLDDGRDARGWFLLVHGSLQEPRLLFEVLVFQLAELALHFGAAVAELKEVFVETADALSCLTGLGVALGHFPLDGRSLGAIGAIKFCTLDFQFFLCHVFCVFFRLNGHGRHIGPGT